MGTVTSMSNRNRRRFASSVHELSDTYLICRDLGHAWDFREDSVLYDSRGKRPIEVTRTVRCLRCAMDRIDHYELPSFMKLRTRYIYPDHYLLARQQHGIAFTRSDARSEFYTRRHGDGFAATPKR